MDPILPERLDAIYVGEDGKKHRPVMIHRAILGSLERFIGVLIEHYAGKFPLWLTPTQVVIATITSEADDYAREVAQKLQDIGIRTEIDLRNEKISYKVREHSLQKIPLIFVVGKSEAQNQTVALRRLGGDSQENLSLQEALLKIQDEAKPPIQLT
jgi:threonyl-tRNA synthetase